MATDSAAAKTRGEWVEQAAVAIRRATDSLPRWAEDAAEALWPLVEARDAALVAERDKLRAALKEAVYDLERVDCDRWPRDGR